MQAVLAIAKVTFKEILRDKVLYNTAVFAVILLGVSYLAAKLTFIQPERVVIDFGFSAINLCCSLVGVLVGAGLIAREVERRTFYVSLSRPITRHHFVFGKFLGMAVVLVLNALLLGFALAVILVYVRANIEGTSPLSVVTVEALGLFCLQSIVMASIAILISSFSTTSLSVVICFGVYLIGNNISQIRRQAEKAESLSTRILLEGIGRVFPNLEHFNLKLKVTYGLPVDGAFLAAATFYGLALCMVYLVLAGFLLRSKENS